MEIQYLKELQSQPNRGWRTNKGVDEKTINDLEQKARIRFPQAYKEFLLLAGKENNLMMEGVWDVLEWMQETAKNQLISLELSVEPFWVFDGYDHPEQFKFFYLDHGHNPPVYYFDLSTHPISDLKEEKLYIIKEYDSFSDCITQFIRRATTD
jgi:hypothetical protein